jgi:colicin import membrane protein
MTTELTIMLPEEVAVLADKVAVSKKQEVLTVLQQVFTGIDNLEAAVDKIEVMGVDDDLSIKAADDARLKAKKTRLANADIFNQKRDEVQSLMLDYKLEDSLWLKGKQVMEIRYKTIEEKAKYKADYIKRHEAEQKELRTQKRINAIQPFAEINRIEFENMSEESFETFLSGLKTAHEARVAADLKAEAERIEAARIEAERIENQRLDNERLKIEAIEREEKAAKERQAAKIEADKLKAKNDEILKSERAEKVRIEKELQDKKDAEIRAENQRKEVERLAKIETDKLAKAPIKNQLLVWVETFELPQLKSDNEKATQIKARFESFKKWAKTEIETI